MPRSKTLAVVLLSFFLSSVVIYAPMLIDWMHRNEKAQLAKTRLAELRSELYVPQGVVVLEEDEGIRSLNYFNDCFGAGVKIVYGSNRSTSDIRADYAQALKNTGWELDPGYRPDEYYQVYKRGEENHLAIDTMEMVPNPSEQDFQVIYSIWLIYIWPAYNKCYG